MSKHIELAKKLKALAEKGVGGEKLNAEKMLSDFLKKHNIKLEDIEGEQMDHHFFKLKKEDTQLWYQIVKRVNHEIKVYGPLPKHIATQVRANHFITCTISEYIEIESMLNIYKRLYQAELKIFFRAFCESNDLLVQSKSRGTGELSNCEINDILRASKMASNIKSETYRKQITG